LQEFRSCRSSGVRSSGVTGVAEYGKNRVNGSDNSSRLIDLSCCQFNLRDIARAAKTFKDLVLLVAYASAIEAKR
jgi:hypothetical protein